MRFWRILYVQILHVAYLYVIACRVFLETTRLYNVIEHDRPIFNTSLSTAVTTEPLVISIPLVTVLMAGSLTSQHNKFPAARFNVMVRINNKEYLDRTSMPGKPVRQRRYTSGR